MIGLRLSMALVLLAGAAAVGCGEDLGKSPSDDVAKARNDKVPLRFKVKASKRRYKLGEQVSLRLTLSLARRARAPARVSTFPLGTVHVVSVKRRRRGKLRAIRADRNVIDFEEDPLLLQVEALRKLDPGERVKVPYDVEPNTTKGVLLTDVRLRKDQQHVALVYPLTGPGLYTLRLSYKYTGGRGGKSRVFRGRLLSNKVRFRLVR